MAQSITKNAFFNILLNLAAVVFPLITAPYVSRVLEPEGVGLFNFSGTYAGYFALVAMLGIPTYGVREVAKLRDDKEVLSKLVSQLFSIAVYTTFAVSLIYIITIAVTGKLTENYIIFLVAGFVIYLAPFKINWYYQGIEEFGVITKVSLIVRTLSVICLFVFVRNKEDLIIYVVLSVLGGVLADIWNYFRLCCSGIVPKLTFHGLKKHMSPLMLLFASSIAVSIYTVLDTLMMGFITDYTETGYYTSAMHISKVIVTAVTSLSLVAVPRISYYMQNKDYENINRLMNKSFSVVSFLAFPVAFGMACIAPTFIPLFFGAKFIGAVAPLMILSAIVLLIGLNNITGMQVLVGMGYDKFFLYSMLAGTVSNFILNIIFIPVFGAIGASVSSVIAELLVLMVSGVFVYKKTFVRFKLYEPLKALFGAFTFIPILLLLQHFFNGWWLVCLFVFWGTISYVVVEFLLKNSSYELFKSLLLSRLRRTK